MKAFVKGARDALTSKEPNRALRVVETGLADDEAQLPENKQSVYMLTVFGALALHQVGERDAEAEEWYFKAGMLSRELPLAWQVRHPRVSALLRPV
jgi:hypothetical protein